jgi:antitoxin MazE
MQASIVTIGNSKGIRLPKAILEQCGFERTVDLQVENGRLIIQNLEHPRHNWQKIFAENYVEEDALLAGIVDHSWDEEEWQW